MFVQAQKPNQIQNSHLIDTSYSSTSLHICNQNRTLLIRGWRIELGGGEGGTKVGWGNSRQENILMKKGYNQSEKKCFYRLVPTKEIHFTRKLHLDSKIEVNYIQSRLVPPKMAEYFQDKPKDT